GYLLESEHHPERSRRVARIQEVRSTPVTLLSRRDALQFGGAALVATTLLGTRAQSLLARQDEPVTLTFWHYYGGAHTASLEAVLQKYMDEHPNVTIEARLVNFPD